MSNLGAAYPIDQVGQYPSSLQVPVLAAAVLYEGAMVCTVSASGYAVRAGTSLTGPVLGIAQATAANNLAGAANGDINVNLLQGLFWRPNHGTHTVTITDVGKPVYASDDNTISNDGTDGPLAGVCFGVDTAMGVLVFIEAANNCAVTTDSAGIAEASIVTRFSTVDSGLLCADASIVTRFSTVDSGLLCADASLVLIDSGLLCADASIVTRFSTVDSGLLCADASIITRFSTVDSTTLCAIASINTRMSAGSI